MLRNELSDLWKKFDIYSPRPKYYTFVMSKSEIALFDHTIKDSKVYLEFGMGGSTFRALRHSKAKIYSVDSDLNWLKFMRQYFVIRFMELIRLRFVHVDIGRTKEWGYPVGYDAEDSFPNYSANVFNLIKKEKIDTVLVDGRFRVACVLKTLLECQSNENLIIIIHDFWNRPTYHILLKYLNAIKRTDTMGVFKIKDSSDLKEILTDYDIYKFDYR